MAALLLQDLVQFPSACLILPEIVIGAGMEPLQQTPKE